MCCIANKDICKPMTKKMGDIVAATLVFVCLL